MSYNQVRASLGEKARTAHNVQSISNFEDTHPAAPSLSKLTLGSTAYNFYNPHIAKERGRPNVFSKPTAGTVFGGGIGSQGE
jgi:hypothetical protein